jgi:ubiquinone biosynthesis protein COQ4
LGHGIGLFLKVAVNPSDTRAATDGTVYVNVPVLPRLLRRFEKDAGGRRLLRERPRLDSRGVDFDQLAALPAGTLGHAFAEFYRMRGLDPDALQDLPPVVEGDEAYVALRLRQSHDLWHIVTGIATDLPGEILLQVFTFGQLHTPSAFLLGVIGTLQRAATFPDLPRRALHAYRRGRHAAFLPTASWEELFARPLEEVRRELRL